MKKLFFVIAAVAFTSYANAQDTSSVTTDTQNKQVTTTDTQNSQATTTDTYTSPGRNISGNKNFSLSLGVEPTLPVGHFNDLSGFGIGGSLEGEFKPGNRVGITVNAGYIDYSGKTVNAIKYPDFKYWPVLGGLKLYMGEKAYVHGQAGAGFGTNDLGTSFWYGGGIGFNLSKSIDAELKYTGWKQQEVATTNTTGTGGGIYGGGNEGGTTTTPGTGTTTGSGGGIYGGHYSTIGLRLAYKF